MHNLNCRCPCRWATRPRSNSLATRWPRCRLRWCLLPCRVVRRSFRRARASAIYYLHLIAALLPRGDGGVRGLCAAQESPRACAVGDFDATVRLHCVHCAAGTPRLPVISSPVGSWARASARSPTRSTSPRSRCSAPLAGRPRHSTAQCTWPLFSCSCDPPCLQLCGCLNGLF